MKSLITICNTSLSTDIIWDKKVICCSMYSDNFKTWLNICRSRRGYYTLIDFRSSWIWNTQRSFPWQIYVLHCMRDTWDEKIILHHFVFETFYDSTYHYQLIHRSESADTSENSSALSFRWWKKKVSALSRYQIYFFHFSFAKLNVYHSSLRLQ